MRPGSRLAFVSHVDRLGGAERSLLDLIEELDHERFRVSVLVPGEGEVTAALRSRNVRTMACPALGPLHRSASLPGLTRAARRLARGSRQVLAALRAEAPHLVHANSTTAALFAARGARSLGLPLIWHLRDLVPLGLIGTVLGRRCARIVATSEAVAELAARSAKGVEVVRIPVGIRCERFEAREVEGADRSARGPRFLAIGQLVDWKGWETLLRAAAFVRRRLPEASFVVVGTGDAAEGDAAVDRWRGRARHLGVAHAVRFVGACDDVRVHLAAADVLVHAAYPEPFGRVVVEAMAWGLPVVVMGGAHGPAELVRDRVDGLHARERSPECLARALLLLAEDAPLRRALGASGKQRARACFDRRAMAAATAELYERVLGEGG